MNVLDIQGLQNFVKFYIDNAVALSQQADVEVDAELKIRVIPNKDKNIDAKLIFAGSGKIIVPGKEEVIAAVGEENKEENEQNAE